MENLLGPYVILDLTDEKGLLCGKILGDLGADVIKVEKPGGDRARSRGPFYKDDVHPEKSLYWFAYNTGKRGITLNLESRDGQEIFHRLAQKADVVLESFSPGYLDKLGMGYSALSKLNPGIIMTSISPFGQTGPYGRHKASDLTCMAMGGMMFMLGDEDRPPVRISAAEQSYGQSSVQAAIGTLMALYKRGTAGAGQHVDVSMQESVLWTTVHPLLYWYNLKYRFSRSGFRQRRMDILYRRVFPCKDGYVGCSITFGRMAGPMQARLVKVMDEEGYAGDLKEVDWSTVGFENVSQRDFDKWEDALVKYFLNHTKAELEAIALERKLLLVPLKNTKEICEYSQLQARDYWVELPHPELGSTVTYPGFYFKSTAVSGRVSRCAPLIGEHNDDVYTELGLSREELIPLKENGVI